MANGEKTQTAATQAPSALAIGALVLGWLIPGAGHLLLRRWVRGLLLMASIFTMFYVGLAMDGKLYAFNTGDLLDILGFVGDIGSGMLYISSHVMNWGQGAIQRAVADYGTKYMIVAGLLNVVACIDAYHIGIGKKK